MLVLVGPTLIMKVVNVGGSDTEASFFTVSPQDSPRILHVRYAVLRLWGEQRESYSLWI